MWNSQLLRRSTLSNSIRQQQSWQQINNNNSSTRREGTILSSLVVVGRYRTININTNTNTISTIKRSNSSSNNLRRWFRNKRNGIYFDLYNRTTMYSYQSNAIMTLSTNTNTVNGPYSDERQTWNDNYYRRSQQHHQHYRWYGVTSTSSNTSTDVDTDKNNNNNHITSHQLDAWYIRRPEKGSGFDNFTPPPSSKSSSSAPNPRKNDNDDNNNNDNDDDDTTGVKSKGPKDTKKTSKKKSSSSSSSSENDDESKYKFKGGRFDYDITDILIAIAIFTFISTIMRRTQQQDNDLSHRTVASSNNTSNGIPYNGNTSGSGGGDGGGGDGFIVTQQDGLLSWHAFLRLLQQRDILKIVVSVDRKFARIFLKPDAIGLNTSSDSGSFGDSTTTTTSGGATNTYSNNGIEHHNSTSAGSYQNKSPSELINLLRFYRIQIGSVESFEQKIEDAQRAIFGPDTTNDVPIQYTPENIYAQELLTIGMTLLIGLVSLRIFTFVSSLGMGGGASGGGRNGGGMGGIFQIGKSTAKKIKKEDVNVTFKDVAGCDEAKREIMEFVDFLKDSTRFTDLGAKIPKGALLCGPPGTGKTLLAKAVAGEAGVPFYSISGSDFIEMFVGVGPSRVRDLFNEARANAPCIVFIDEIDAVGRQRGSGSMGGNDERENTLNQLLVEMDGFTPTTGVVVLAGTNRVDILDNALTRAGRFDRQITVDKPDLKGRKDIFKVHLKGITLEDTIDNIAGRLAGLTPGFAGADIANICNEAAIVAARRKGEQVTFNDFERATERIIGGLESIKIMSQEERSIVAHHEAGHAIAGWFLEHADPLLKVTIIPRASGALGFAQYLPKEVFLRTEEQIMDIVCMALAGRAAEEIFFGRVTTGASDDLKRVTQLIYSTIQLYGMNTRLGQLSFPKNPNSAFDDRPYSEKTAKAMDEEAKRLVDVAYKRTLALLQSKKNEIDILAKMLLEKETITHDDIVMAIGNRPFTPDPMYEEFIKQRVNQQEQDATAGKEDTTVEQQSATDGSSSSSTPPLGIV